MTPKKKILFIHHGSGWGGAPNSLIKTIKELDTAKYDVLVLLIKDSIVRKKLEEIGINYIVARSFFYRKIYSFYFHWVPYYVPFYYFPKFFKLSLFWLLSRFYFAKRELKHLDYDIAHLNSSQISDWLAPCKKKGKVVMHIREPISKGTFGFRYTLFRSQMRKYCDKIIAISFDNAKRIDLPEKTSVVYNFSEVNNNFVKEDSYFSKKVLYLGGSAPYKGFHNMVNALEFLDNDIKVYFGGIYDSQEENEFKFKIKKILGIGSDLRKTLRKMRQSHKTIELGLIFNVTKYIGESCCLIAPFAASHFARPVIEAYLNKKPAIGTNVEGMDEIITQNYTGLIVKNENGRALADAINYLCNHPIKAREMGENGFKLATEKFTCENVKQIISIYDSL